jgi:DNA-binding transcriptional MerR regulator
MTTTATKRYSLRKASELTNVSERTLRRYVKSGKLPCEFEQGQYYVHEDDLLHLFGERRAINDYVTSVAMPRGTDSKEILALVNQGFGTITEKITERYQDTVSPIINNTLSTNEQAFLKAMAETSQKMINNMIGLLRLPNASILPPEYLLDQILQGISLPDEIRDILAKGLDEINKVTL